ncbi:hypothetical protein A3I42_03620 [Candidatus Uhrbacteria bacterium RIFCSPLOWO2_02_FULL_49_11]|uniref:Ribbon-helix-helix protein CopG domain-containing protein n=1 Tax=Candidatus Uhrbacteria bacterium RIFCSPLOWO2_02_FULL_49_11 TaxID=1802409 RepID=A0A1F7VC48_9BACT|nr:MAG: hypothetical protein A3I42_03620 [Candidatus Uhrbacteria bacterium RIFCSPLOWO2_02_FULL_49_11]
MSIVNFAVSKPLEKRVEHIMREKGFTSKAEFFRFAAIQYIDILSKPVVSEEERFRYLTTALANEVVKAYRGKKVPTAREQLTDL